MEKCGVILLCDGSITAISHDTVTWIVSDWHVRIQSCYVIEAQKLLEEYQNPFHSQRVGSGNETISTFDYYMHTFMTYHS